MMYKALLSVLVFGLYGLCQPALANPLASQIANSQTHVNTAPSLDRSQMLAVIRKQPGYYYPDRRYRFTGPREQYQRNFRVQERRVYQKKRVRAKAKPRPVYHFAEQREASGNTVFIFDPKHLKWGAYDEDGALVKQGYASGGKSYCADVGRACKTPVGRFNVYRKGSSGCKSRKYPLPNGGAPMPYCMFFKGGYAIHGSPHVPAYNASHGCIRVLPVDAKWLHANFIKHGTTVIVRPYH